MLYGFDLSRECLDYHAAGTDGEPVASRAGSYMLRAAPDTHGSDSARFA